MHLFKLESLLDKDIQPETTPYLNYNRTPLPLFVPIIRPQLNMAPPPAQWSCLTTDTPAIHPQFYPPTHLNSMYASPPPPLLPSATHRALVKLTVS